MVTSGWRIYNASPIFPGISFPREITLGGWLAGALQWHFAAMWLLVINFAGRWSGLDLTRFFVTAICQLTF